MYDKSFEDIPEFYRKAKVLPLEKFRPSSRFWDNYDSTAVYLGLFLVKIIYLINHLSGFV